jgi:hypothetical protein
MDARAIPSQYGGAAGRFAGRGGGVECVGAGAGPVIPGDTVRKDPDDGRHQHRPLAAHDLSMEVSPRHRHMLTLWGAVGLAEMIIAALIGGAIYREPLILFSDVSRRRRAVQEPAAVQAQIRHHVRPDHGSASGERIS